MPWLKLGILAVISSGNNRDLLSGQTQGDGSGTEGGLDLAKVSFGIFDSCLDLSSSSDQPSSDPTHCQGAKETNSVRCPPL